MLVSSLSFYFPKALTNNLLHTWHSLGAILISCQGVGDVLHPVVGDFATFVDAFCKTLSAF